MRSPAPRRILITLFATALLASQAVLPLGHSHADEAVRMSRLLPVPGAVQYAEPLTILDTLAPGANTDASKERGPQSETSIAGSPLDPNSLVAGSNDIANLSAMNAYRSLDGGQQWQRIALPSRCRGGSAADPSLGVNLSGEYFYAYLSYTCTSNYAEITVSHSTDKGLTWTPVTAFHDFINGSDKEMLTVDNNPTSPTKGRIYVAWDENFATAQHIELVWSDDNGLTWHAPVQVDINGSGGVIYADPAVGPDGRVYVIWNDYGVSAQGRYSLIQFSAASNTPAAGYAPTFSKNVSIASSGINLFNPTRFGIPAQPSRGIAADPSLNVDSTGRLYALWTQGTRGSAVTTVYCQTSTNSGQTWSTPVKVNDDTGASDFFPWGAIDPATNAFHVGFYSTRLDPSNNKTNVYTAVSTTGGASFSANTRISTSASDESANNPSADANQYGDYLGITMQGGKEHPVWTDTRAFRVAAEEVFSAAN